ncbi:NBAS subunit of NRZ tethering complex-like [Oppia nitens]|uniref:NBAS subunit of NRZ tethering complex-like n=1 Tax=Oppia nitens TaxID=1686743 RepID=UPI0023DC1DB2|nr:NBAS subunit of NRZ tethering complex-like [Oppia nitens]
MTIIDSNDQFVVRHRKNVRPLTARIHSNDDQTVDNSSDSQNNDLVANETLVNRFSLYVTYYLLFIVNTIRLVIFRITGIRSVEPTKQILNNLLQKFPLDDSSSLSPEERFEQTLSDNDFDLALELAVEYGFDKDLVYQPMWRNSQICQESVDNVLSKITKQMWILRESIECVAEDMDSMKYLLQFGLNLTNYDNFKSHFYSRVNSNTIDIKTHEEVDDYSECNDNKIDWNQLSLESKQVLIWRKRLLQYLDRLNVYQMILSYRNRQHINSRYNHKFYQMFREMSSLEAAIHFGHNSDYNAISILLTYEPKDILEHRLVILSNIDETLSPKRYSSLLPKLVSPKIKGYEVYGWNQILLREEDWIESEFDSIHGLNSSQFEADFYAENTHLLHYKCKHLSKSLVTQWYSERSRQILALTWIVSNALDLVEIGIKHLVPNLDNLCLDLDIFSLVVYESHFEYDIDFNEFQEYSHKQKIDVLMTSALNDEQEFLNFIYNYLNIYIIKICKDDPKQLKSIGRQLFKDYLLSVAKIDLNFCLKVFENSSLSNTEIDRQNKKPLIEDPCDLIEFAIDCIYESQNSEQLETCFKIMECLPQRDMIPLIAGNDITKINQLNHLNDLADKLENYLVVAEIIEQYDTPPTIQEIRDLEITNNKEEVKQLFIRLTRSCCKKDKAFTVNQWIEVFKNLEEVWKMCFSDNITEDQLFEIFVQTLLCSSQKSNFALAATYMQLETESKSKKKLIPIQKTKKLLLNAAQEYINSSDSSHDYNIVLAKECLEMLDEKEQQKDTLILEELNLIESLNLIENNFNLKLLPIQIRLIPQPRIEIIEKILKSSPKAYTKTLQILKIAKLLDICHDFGSDFMNGTILSLIANMALNSHDFKHCFNCCEMIIKNSYKIGWKVCLELGLNDKYDIIENKLYLLCFAVTYCDNNNENNDQNILDIINAIKNLKQNHSIKFVKNW